MTNHVYDESFIRSIAKQYCNGNKSIALDLLGLQESPEVMAHVAMRLLVAIEEERQACASCYLGAGI